MATYSGNNESGVCAFVTAKIRTTTLAAKWSLSYSKIGARLPKTKRRLSDVSTLVDRIQPDIMISEIQACRTNFVEVHLQTSGSAFNATMMLEAVPQLNPRLASQSAVLFHRLFTSEPAPLRKCRFAAAYSSLSTFAETSSSSGWSASQSSLPASGLTRRLSALSPYIAVIASSKSSVLIPFAFSSCSGEVTRRQIDQFFEYLTQLLWDEAPGRESYPSCTSSANTDTLPAKSCQQRAREVH